MGAADRTVQILRLRAPSAQAAARAAHQLEDALRCASLPDADERVLLVRRLQLGRLPAGLSPQGLSLLIEQRVAAAGGEWVNGDETRAAHSNTVFFAHRMQAAEAALRWRARGSALDAWYWPLALPGMAVQASPPVFLGQLLDTVSQWREAAAALPALWRSAQAGATQVWWREHLPPEWQARLAAAGLDDLQPAQAGATPARRVDRAALSDAAPERTAAVRERHALRVPRLSHADPAPTSRELVPALAHAGSPHRSRGGPVPAPVAPEPAGATGEKRDRGDTPPPTAAAPASASRSAGPSTRKKTRAPAAARPADGEAPRTPGPRQSVATSFPVDAVATCAGGLLFLWPVLERLGFAAWDAGHPGSWLVPRVLGVALHRLRAPQADPAWAMLASLPVNPQAPDVPAQQVARWLGAWRQQARGVWRPGLARLVLRPGWLVWSATHIDLHFHPRDADLCVRRAGLDIDPGWVASLQRVVSFHYDRTERAA